MKARRYRSPRSKPELGLFLANEDVGHRCEATPEGWRLIGLASSGLARKITIDVTRDGQCSCRVRHRPCRHVKALAAVGLLEAAAVHTGR